MVLFYEFSIMKFYSCFACLVVFINSSRPWYIQVGQQSQLVFSISEGNLFYATAEVWLPPFVVWKTAIRNAICRYYPAIRNSPSLPYDRQPLLLIARGCHFFRTPIFTEILQQRRWGQLINKVTAIRQPVHMHIHFTVLYMVFKRSDGPT